MSQSGFVVLSAKNDVLGFVILAAKNDFPGFVVLAPKNDVLEFVVITEIVNATILSAIIILHL